MAKVLVVYSSKTGNTAALAEAVSSGAREVSGTEVTLKQVEDVSNDDLISHDAIIVGSPVYFGSMSSNVKEMFDRSVAIRRQLEGKIGAAFTTSGHPTGGKETTIFSILQAMLIHGMIVVGDPISAGGHYGVASTGRPDQKGLDEGRALGRRVAELTKRLTMG
jgi:NAD(P)H dehydrogenase (quinone)